AARLRVAALVPLFLLSIPAPGVSAQQPADPAVAIEGRVTDPQGEPVAGARISAALPSGEVRSAVAGGDGRYRLVIGAGVASRVRVSADGYHAIELDDVSVSSGVRRDIVLEPSPFRLAAVSVIGRTRPELAAIPGAATIIGPAVLRDRAPISVMDALRTVP